MLSEEHLDAVAIAVPPMGQFQIAMESMAMGLHVFAEKPLAVTTEQAEQLVCRARRMRITHAVDYIFPEIDLWRRLKRLVEQRVLGQLTQVMVDWQFLSFDIEHGVSSWKTDVAQGGGALAFFFSHVLFYLEHYAGEISSIDRSTLHYSPNSLNGGEVGVDLSLSFRTGATGIARLSCNSTAGPLHRLVASFEYGEVALQTHAGVSGFNMTVASNSGTQTISSQEWGAPREDERVSVVRRIARRFVLASLMGRGTHPSFDHGLRVQRLIEDIRASSARQALGGLELKP